MDAAKQTYINTQEASLRLSRWVHHVPIVIFAEWRVDALYEIIMILSGQTLNRSRGGQNIHAKVKKALSQGGRWKPTRNEFRAFWLNWGAQLKLEWLELLHRHGWDDLMDWSSDGPGMVDVSHLGNYNLMAEADSVAQRSQLTPQQAEFRGHILAMKVLSVDHGRMQIEFPYELDTDFETLVKSIEAYTPAPEQVNADAMSLDGSDDIASIKRKHDEDIAALSRKHDEDIAAQNQMHGDDMANVKQDNDELRAENAVLRGGVLTSKRPAKEQLKNTVDAILEQEME